MAVLNNSALVGAAGKGGGAAALPQRSLRFNSADSSYLSKTFSSAGNRKKWTWSGWVKRSALGSNQLLFGSSTLWTELYFNSSNQLQVYAEGGSLPAGGVYLYSNAVFRDTSAWMHVVWVLDTTQSNASDRLRVYVNGQQITWTSSISFDQNLDFNVNSTNVHGIGMRIAENGLKLDAYLAHITFLDGIAATPSAFAYTDPVTGRWEPKAYAGSYSGNSFYLDFSDNSAATAAALGADRSGLGNNWVPNNLQGSQVGLYSSTVTLTGTTYPANPPANGFDGNSATAVYVDGTLYWNASPYNITVNNSLVIGQYAGGSNTSYTIKVNGTTVLTQFVPAGAFGITQNVNLAASLSKPFVLNSLEIIGGTASINTLSVDGAVLIDSTPASIDSLRDHPVSAGVDTGLGGQVSGNYATLNPLNLSRVGDGITTTNALSNGNLDATFRNAACLGTIGINSGKWYWETTLTSAPTSTQTVVVGVASGSYNVGGAYPRYIGNDAISWGYVGFSGNLANSGTSSAYGAGCTSGDVIGIALDCDNGKLFFSKNGVWQNSGNPSTGTNPASSALTAGPYFPAVSDGGGPTAITCTFNFGARAFSYQAPAGFKALCDQNLPAPLIARPNTVMDVALYTGNGSTQAISGLGFSPDLVWIKRRDAANYYNELHDIVRGTGKALFSNSNDAESVRDTLTSFNSNGFTVSTQGGAHSGTNASGGTYVGWVFDAGTTTVTNNSGSIPSQVRANPSAGCSIVTYTGNGQNGSSFGHGLSATPEFFIIKSLGIGNWFVWHKSLPSNEYNLVLNNTSPQASLGAAYWYTLNSSILEMTGNAPFKSGPHVMYAWSSVNGLSSFGSFTGNGSTDGPMVTLPFRPALVMLKSSAGNFANWTIVDSKRDTYNVAKTRLFPSDSQAENTGADNIDILSNGFKLRVTEAGANASGGTYIYCAWAESPFKYARAR